MEAEYNYGRIEKITKGWRGDIKNYSIILGGGIHIIDIIQNLFGEKFKIVNIEGNKIVTKKTKFKKFRFCYCCSQKFTKLDCKIKLLILVV